MNRLIGTAIGMALAAGLCGGTVHAQQLQRGAGTRSGAAAAVPQKVTLQKMQQEVTLEVTDYTLKDVMKFIGEITGAELEIHWKTDREEGLDPEMLISVSVKKVPALTLLERVLEKSQTEFSENSWQMMGTGVMEIGPKERLNRHRRIELYDINDLLFVVKTYNQSPEIDLQSVLQSSGSGGGSSQSPFRQNQSQQNLTPADDEKGRRERAKEIEDLVVALVEPTQWIAGGGNAADIRYYHGYFIVNAPDYVHRQINGYPYWPQYSAKNVSGRRVVTLSLDTSNSTVDRLDSYPVSAVAGGIRSGGGSGGGGGGGGGGGSRPGGGG
ncbi:MAG: hypothetical protein JNM07_02235 [Phycisphaerae bacterium]|nr:hypothetical protein [Phycisphaerae bacterium]